MSKRTRSFTNISVQTIGITDPNAVRYYEDFQFVEMNRYEKNVTSVGIFEEVEIYAITSQKISNPDDLKHGDVLLWKWMYEKARR